MYISEILTNEENEKCWQAFKQFDKDGNGTIDFFELRAMLQAVGQNPTDEELLAMIDEVDNNRSGCLEYIEFVKLFEKQKLTTSEAVPMDSDTVDAFVAMGGNPDMSGKIRAETLIATVQKFHLTIDIEEADEDNSGFIDYQEFSSMLKLD